MENNEFDDLIQKFVDGELSDKDEETLKEHLKSCKECQNKLYYKEDITALIRKAKEDVNPPKNLINIIIRSITKRKIYRINWRYIALGAAATLILSIILFVYFVNLPVPVARNNGKKQIHDVESYEMKDKEITEPHDKKIGVTTTEQESKKEEEVILATEKPLKTIFEETRLVFPEDGSVVGDKFDVVIILKEPGREIELNIDGEKRMYESKDSNILFIQSDSLPALENGLHYLSLIESTQKTITFFKEG